MLYQVADSRDNKVIVGPIEIVWFGRGEALV